MDHRAHSVFECPYISSTETGCVIHWFLPLPLDAIRDFSRRLNEFTSVKLVLLLLQTRTFWQHIHVPGGVLVSVYEFIITAGDIGSLSSGWRSDCDGRRKARSL